MLLYLEDWRRYPTAIVHESTSNKSFVRLSALYRKMGIKNHTFMLALLNPELEHVDPFDPNLTAEQILMVVEEAAENPWYHFREIARAPGKAGDMAQPVEANRANIALWWSFFNHIQFLLVQPRQTGKSFSTDTLMVWLLFVRCLKTKINLLTKDDKLRRENIDRLKEIIGELPPYLDLRSREDTTNGEEITIKALGNHYQTNVPRSSEKDANNLGRGITTPVVHIDEPPFQRHIGLAVMAMLASMGNVIERAQAANAPYGVIMTTTAGMRNDPSGAWVYKNIVQASAPWSELFLDCANLDELKVMVRRNSPAGKLQINGTFDHRQLGKTDEWLRDKIEHAMQEGETAERDYLNIWTSGNERSPFSKDVTEAINNSKRGADYEQGFPEGYILRWYIPREKIAETMANGKFVMGVDTSEASGRDDICLAIVNVATGGLVCAGSFNETNIFTFSQWLANLMIDYENITAIIERRSTGIAVLDMLVIRLQQAGIDPFKRLFNRIVNDQDESETNLEKMREIKAAMYGRDEYFYSTRKQHFGFATSASGLTSRTGLYTTTLKEATKNHASKIHDQMLIQQLLGLVNKDGRIDHASGEHDDMVIAWLLANWFITTGKHLSHYGIDSRLVLSEARPVKAMSQEDYYQKVEQDAIRREIEEIYEKMMNETDENASLRLELRLRTLDKRLILQDDDAYSLDDLLRSARESRRARSMSYADESNQVYAGSDRYAAQLRQTDPYYEYRRASSGMRPTVSAHELDQRRFGNSMTRYA